MRGRSCDSFARSLRKAVGSARSGTIGIVARLSGVATKRSCKPLLWNLWIAIAICAAIVTGSSLYSGALAQNVSHIVLDAEQAEKAGAHDRAIDLYSTALASDSISNTERRKILKQRARANERINQIDRAAEDWSSAVNTQPVDPAMYGSRGFFYLRLHRYDDALADFAKGETLDAKSPTFAYGTGHVYSERGNYDEAINAYNKAISLRPDHATALLARGEAYLVQKNYRNAQLDFERVLAEGHVMLPTYLGRVYLGLGVAKMRANQFTQAVPDLDKGLGILPNHLSGLSARAFALEKLGDRKRALEDYDRILILKPDDSWAMERRTKLQVR